MSSVQQEVARVGREAHGSLKAGARWLRCDLHVHTPFDGEKKFGEDVRAAIEAFKKEKPQRLADIADRFVTACRSAAGGVGMDLLALADHNSIDGYRYLREQFNILARQALDQGLAMPVILPGVEFSVGGERCIHFLVIFAAATDPDDIDRAIAYVFGPADRFDPKNGTPRATGQSVDAFLNRLYEFCRPPSGDRDMKFVVLPAHIDGQKGILREVAGGAVGAVATSLWDEMKHHLRQRVITRRDWHGFQAARPFPALPQAFKELLWRWAAVRRGEDWDSLTEGQKARHREQKHWPLVECSDPDRYEAIGSCYTWLKMEVPDVEGIRLALLDPESRLRRMADGPPGSAYPRLKRLYVKGTDFFDEVEIPLSPCLTTLIGVRGTGKSTVVEYVRHMLDRARRETWFGGAGLQERDWGVLCDFVFEGGEVPERIRELVVALQADVVATATRGKALDPANSQVASLVGHGRLIGYFFNALTRRERLRLEEVERFLPEDLVIAQVRNPDRSFKPIETGSVGQKSTAILSLLLSAGDQPIIIDQPEDDLDNQYVYNVVVDLLRRRKFARQVIIATHNANIPVNGDAELIVALGVEGRVGVVLGAGSIDRAEIKNLPNRCIETAVGQAA